MKSILAEGILKRSATGERDPMRQQWRRFLLQHTIPAALALSVWMPEFSGEDSEACHPLNLE